MSFFRPSADSAARTHRSTSRLAFIAGVTSVALLLSACSAITRPDEDYQLTLGILGDSSGYPATYEEAAIRMAVDEVNAAEQGIKISLLQAEAFEPEAETPEGELSEGESEESGIPEAEEPVEGELTEPDAENGESVEDPGAEEEIPEPTEPSLPESELSSLFTNGVHAILAPHTLSITESMVAEAIAANVPLISTAEANPESYNWVTQGLYLNASPTSRLLGQALAEKLTIDEQQFIGVVRLNDFYTTLVKEGLEAELVPTTGQIVVDAPYAQETMFFNPVVDVVLNRKPPVLTVLGAEETPTLVNLILHAGYAGEQLVFLGRNAQSFGDQLSGSVHGALAISADFNIPEEFKEKLDGYLAAMAEALPEPAEGEEAVNLELPASVADLSAAARAYDQVHLLALAAIAAGGLAADGLSQQMRAVSGGVGMGKEPVTINDFTTGVAELYAGQNIDFDGVSGGIAYERSGELQQAIFTVYHYDEANNLGAAEQFIVPNPAFIDLLPEPLNAAD